jgi:hypothetical protein
MSYGEAQQLAATLAHRRDTDAGAPTNTPAPPFALDDTVKRCIGWKESPAGWYYFIETTHETFPRFAIGERRDDGSVRPIFKCGLEGTARKYWEELVETGMEPELESNLEPIPRARPPYKLFATIKRSSKYYHQGLSDPTDSKSKPVAFEVFAINAIPDCDGYDYRFNSNQYRREDIDLWIQLPGGKLKRL